MQESELYDVHPVDMLVDLVIGEEIDPWDVDVAEIASRFLERVRSMERVNLRLSGRTLLAAALLLRIKSERVLEREEEVEDEEEYEPVQQADEVLEGGDDEPPALPLPARRRVKRRTTIFELVEALQKALSEEILRRNFPRKGEAPLVIQVEEDDIRERIDRVYRRVLGMCRTAEVLRFSHLVEGLGREETVETLLCLLYLSSQGKIVLWQEEIFGEIFISLPPSSESP